MERRQDIVLGIVMAVVGFAAAAIGRSYSGASGIYPTVLGLTIAFLALGIAAAAVFRSADAERPIIDEPRAFATATLAGALYIGAVPLLGFFTSSAVLTAILPAALGLRRPVMILATTVIFIAIVYVLFILVLERPLPREFFQAD